MFVTGADPNQSDEKYRTPFHYFLQYSRSSRWTEVVEMLIRHGADVESRDIKFGRTALLHACLNFYQVANLPKIIDLLVKHKADVNVLDKHNRSVLHYLTSASAVDLDVGRCVELILPNVKQQTVDSVSSQGTTALTQAARMGCHATLRQLIPLANKNVTDSFGKNIFEYLKELGERKVRAICSCCQSVAGSLELAPTLVKRLMSKERIRLRQPEEFVLAELGRYLLDISPYVTFLYEDQLYKSATPKWMEFLDFWNNSQYLSLNDIVRVQRFIRDMTHPCKLPPLIPARRNKCGWCDAMGTVHNYVVLLTEKAGQMDRRFRPSSVISYGSIAEGSKLFAPVITTNKSLIKILKPTFSSTFLDLFVLFFRILFILLLSWPIGMKILPIRRQSVTAVAMSSSINSCRKRNSPKFLHAKSVSTTMDCWRRPPAGFSASKSLNTGRRALTKSIPLFI
jgi:hypothetical protein